MILPLSSTLSAPALDLSLPPWPGHSHYFITSIRASWRTAPIQVHMRKASKHREGGKGPKSHQNLMRRFDKISYKSRSHKLLPFQEIRSGGPRVLSNEEILFFFNSHIAILTLDYLSWNLYTEYCRCVIHLPVNHWAYVPERINKLYNDV